MSEPFVGEIKLISFNFPPKGWAFCNGQLLPINQNQALFSLLGTFYGGDGIQTFALPNLEGRVIVGIGQGAGLSNYTIGESAGVEGVSLNLSNLPVHNHYLEGGPNVGVSASPASEHFASSPVAMGPVYGNVLSGGHMLGSMIQNTGLGASHSNLMPTLTMNYVIALQGIFPSRN